MHSGGHHAHGVERPPSPGTDFGQNCALPHFMNSSKLRPHGIESYAAQASRIETSAANLSETTVVMQEGDISNFDYLVSY